MEERRGISMVLMTRLESKVPVGRPRRRWVDNIKMQLGEMGIDLVNCIRLDEGEVQWRSFVMTGISFPVE
jgi:hypothetical protein